MQEGGHESKFAQVMIVLGAITAVAVLWMSITNRDLILENRRLNTTGVTAIQEVLNFHQVQLDTLDFRTRELGVRVDRLEHMTAASRADNAGRGRQ